jgi:DNA polymerase-4
VFVSAGACILHADLDAFFASVEQRDDRALRGRPVLVGGGVVLAASYEARACGVRSAMGGTRARALCPDAVVVRPRFEAYVEASRRVFAIFEDTAPEVEKLSIDEASLDVRGLEHISGTPVQIARALRARVREEVDLPLSVGVASTKHLAKVLSAAAKPDGLLVVEAGEELRFLHPQPVERLWGVGPATAARLHAAGLRTVGDVAAIPLETLTAAVGRAAGRHVHALAHNRDPRPVRSGARRRSFGSQSALGRRARSPAERDAVLVALADRVTRRMRAAGRTGRTVVLRLRFGDFERATRSRTLPRATASSAAVLEALRELLAAEDGTVERRGLTLLGVTVTNLARDDGQLELALDGAPRAAVDAVVDDVRRRFGTRAVQRGTLVARGDGMAPWLVPGLEGVEPGDGTRSVPLP